MRWVQVMLNISDVNIYVKLNDLTFYFCWLSLKF